MKKVRLGNCRNSLQSGKDCNDYNKELEKDLKEVVIPFKAGKTATVTT
jgi:hypothetical protein